VGDGDSDAVAVREPLLETVLPSSTVRAVAAAAIGQDGEFLGSDLLISPGDDLLSGAKNSLYFQSDTVII